MIKLDLLVLTVNLEEVVVLGELPHRQFWAKPPASGPYIYAIETIFEILPVVQSEMIDIVIGRLLVRVRQ